MKKDISPCIYCTKVACPENCENKNCGDWQEWFIRRWELIRGFPRYHMEIAPLEQPGIYLGGRKYTHPETIRQYLRKDPCQNCVCPKDLCKMPCPTRRAWDLERKGASS